MSKKLRSLRRLPAEKSAGKLLAMTEAEEMVFLGECEDKGEKT